MDHLPTYNFLTACLGHLENISSLTYADLLNGDLFYYIISKKNLTKIYLLVSPLILWKKVFKCTETIKLMVANAGFTKTLIYVWKPKFYHWQHILSIVLLEVTHFIHFWENFCQVYSVNNHTLSLVISSKNGVKWKSGEMIFLLK